MKYVGIMAGLFFAYTQVQSYEFRFYCFSGYIVTTPACTTIHVYTTSQFDEMTIIWDNRPPLITYLDDFRSGSWGLWYTFSSPALDAYVDGCVNANQPIWFATRCSLWLWPGSIVWWYHSKETNASFKAELIPMPSGYSLQHDARVDEYNPAINFGTDSLWNCDNNSNMRQISYFGFLPPASIEESEKSSIIFRVYPSPFCYSTSISYSVLPTEATERVVLSVYDVSGKRIKNLVDGTVSPGEHMILWKGDNANGNRVPAGVYFFRLTTGNKTLTTKAMFLY